jgi:hypothetical protein
VKIVQSIITNNDCYKVGKKITPKGLMLHSVGSPQPSAEVFVRVYNVPNLEKAVHAFIDGNTGAVHQTLPWNHRAWHCGGGGNSTHIGIEMCEPACIKYTHGSTFTCSDVPTARAVAQRTYDTAVQLFAHLCTTYRLDPMKDIISHAEGHALGIASNHGDPEHLWKGLSMGYTMDTFRKAVKATMEGTDTIWRVQVGAYRVRENSEIQLAKVKKAGFKDAFITTGNGIFRVQVGAYRNRQNAEIQLAKVKAAGFTDAFIKGNT